METVKRYEGWVSEHSRKWSGHAVYRRPDGTEVEVTHVTELGAGHGTALTDIVSVGEVASWVSSHDKYQDRGRH